MSTGPVQTPPSAAPLVVGVDCSTTSVKAIVWDARGSEVSRGQVSLSLQVPSPGAAEQDPREWWEALASAVRAATAAVDAERIVALAITHQRETFVCLDAAGEPVRPAQLWMDVRAAEQVAEHGTDRVHAITGKPANPTPAWYKLLWLRRHEPRALEATARVAEVHGYLVQRLTGTAVTSAASADPLGLVDLEAGRYSGEMLDAVGLTTRHVDRLVPPGAPIGSLLPAVAAELGLPASVVVVAGAGDGQCAGLGAGVTDSRRAYLNIGTGLIAGTVSSTYAPSRAYRALLGADPGTYAYELFIGAGTLMVTWFLDTFLDPPGAGGGSPGGLEQHWERRAAAVAPGSDGLLTVPYWNGALTPHWDPYARGIMIGLTPAHDRAAIYRSILEGVALELRLCLEHAEPALEAPIGEFITMGGGSRSPVWCQMIADVLQRPLVLCDNDEASSLGAGMLAAVGAGIHPDVPAAAAAMSSGGRRFEPDAEAGRAYDAVYARYRAVYPAVAPLFAVDEGES